MSGIDFQTVEPEKLTAEFAFPAARRDFLTAEFGFLSEPSPSPAAEFAFAVPNDASRPAKPFAGSRDPFSRPENPLADSRIRFSDRRNPFRGSEREFLARKSNSALRKSLRSPRKPLAGLRKSNSAHVAVVPTVARRFLRVTWRVQAFTKGVSPGKAKTPKQRNGARRASPGRVLEPAVALAGLQYGPMSPPAANGGVAQSRDTPLEVEENPPGRLSAYDAGRKA